MQVGPEGKWALFAVPLTQSRDHTVTEQPVAVLTGKGHTLKPVQTLEQSSISTNQIHFQDRIENGSDLM